MQTNIEMDFKEKVREAVIEILEEDSERFYPLFFEIMEDIALTKAMEEGEKTPEVEEKNILEILKSWKPSTGKVLKGI